MKRLNPYTRLLYAIKDHLSKIKHRHTKVMWVYPIKSIEGQSSWTLNDLYERTMAADQLGYDVKIVANKDGLKVLYEKKMPEIPCQWRYR